MSPVAAPAPRRALVLALWLLLVLLAVVQIVRTPFTADLAVFLPAAPDARQRLLIEQIHSGVPSRTLLLAIEGGDAAARAQASRSLAAALRDSGRFDQVANGEHEGFAGFGQWLFEHRYQLSPAVTPQHFDAVGLRAAIAESTSLLGTPAGEAIKPLLERDPSGETLRIGEALIPARTPRSEDGVWVGRQAPRALLAATVSAPGADIDRQAQAIALVRTAFAPLAAQGLQLRISGAPFFSVDSRARIEHEVQRLALAGALMMCTLLLLAFGSPKALAVAALPVASGVLGGIVAVSLGFGSVHGMTLGFGSTLIGESVDYAIYYLVQSRGGGGGGAQAPGWRAWVRTSWPTVRLGLLTSVCGFAALLWSDFPGLAQLGVFSLAGLATAALTTRYLLPALLPEGARGSALSRRLGQAAQWAIARLPRLRAPVLLLALLAAGLLVQRGELWRADLASLSPVPHAAMQLDAQLRADLGAGEGGTLVMVQGADVEQTLQRAEAASARLETLIEHGAIAGFDSATRLLPSLRTQRQRQAALPPPAALRAALHEATQGGPLSAARLAPFLDEVERARQMPALTWASLRGSAVAPTLDALLLRRADGSAAALLPVYALDDGSVDVGVVEGVLRGLDGTQVLDVGAELGRLYGGYLGAAQAQALLGALGVVLLMAVSLRSWRRLLAVCQPLLLAVLLAMGALAALGVQLGILHLVGLLLVVAIGSNYALFFDMLCERGDRGEETLASLLLANLTTVGSFALLAASSIPVLSAIGSVVAPGALLGLLLAAIFVRSQPVAENPSP
ncbi:MAG: MMPL family transporter [Burkholderiales bacterium]|nr:MMPL family transporter [Burkholderiales bacterium]